MLTCTLKAVGSSGAEGIGGALVVSFGLPRNSIPGLVTHVN